MTFNNLSIHSGRDLNLTGAQARGNSIDVEVGRNLTITSLQDSSDYDSKQKSANIGISVPIGVGTVSGNIGMSKQTIDSNYNSVNEQSGLYAGAGGFNVNVKGHTQLNGAVIASTAPAEFNQLTTGSLGYTNIENSADYKANSSGASIGGGSILSAAISLGASQIPSSLNQSDSANSTTTSAISPASITVGGERVEPVGLSRNTDNAANALTPIFDLQEVQDTMAFASTVGEIGALASNITFTAMQRDRYVQNDKAKAAAEDAFSKSNPTEWNRIMALEPALRGPAIEDALVNQSIQNASPQVQSLYETLNNTNTSDADRQAATLALYDLGQAGQLGGYLQEQHNYLQSQKDYAPGGKYNTASQAITGLLTSAAGGNLQQGLANAAAPYLAGQVGAYFDNLERVEGRTDATIAGRLLTHAAVGAAVAYVGGNDAASGAVGAVSGEAIGMIVMNQRYPGLTPDQLTPAQKEDIRAISTLAATLVGGVTGGSFEDAATAGAAGYNAVVNNGLSSQWQTRRDLNQRLPGRLADACGPTSTAAACTTMLDIFGETSQRNAASLSQTNEVESTANQGRAADEVNKLRALKASYCVGPNAGPCGTGMDGLIAQALSDLAFYASGSYTDLAISAQSQRLYDSTFSRCTSDAFTCTGIALMAINYDPSSLGKVGGKTTTASTQSQIVGRSGNPIIIRPGTNRPTMIGGRQYSGHSLDQMQGRGLTPSIVENTIRTGNIYPTRTGTTGYYDPVNNIRVLINSRTGNVVTAIPGAPK